MKQNKAGAKEDSIQVGDTVRIVDMAKRKGELTKGFKISWSRELYTVHKVKRPIPSEESRPNKFFVKDKETSKALKEPFTITTCSSSEATSRRHPILSRSPTRTRR